MYAEIIKCLQTLRQYTRSEDWEDNSEEDVEAMMTTGFLFGSFKYLGNLCSRKYLNVRRSRSFSGDPRKTSSTKFHLISSDPPSKAAECNGNSSSMSSDPS